MKESDKMEDHLEHNNSQMSNGEVDSEEEENPALEGHFLTEGSVMEVVLEDGCPCGCHQEPIEGFEHYTPFSCSKCSQQFCCKCQFLTHRELHRGERKYACQVCGKSYLYKSDLARHRPVHSDVKPHVCNVCNRSFNQVGHLITHRLIHTGEKPFECDVCHKPFNRKSNLQKHKMTHTGERPFHCLICGARFGRKGDLQRHTMLHTGERPYKCEVCDKSFSQKPHLLSHQSVHTGERPYKCIDCDKSFNRKSNLLKHQESKCPVKNRELHLSDFTTIQAGWELKTAFMALPESDLLVDASNNNLPVDSVNPNDLSVLRARLSTPTVSVLSKISDVDASSVDKTLVRSRLEDALLQSGQRSPTPAVSESSPDENSLQPHDDSFGDQSSEVSDGNTTESSYKKDSSV